MLRIYNSDIFLNAILCKLWSIRFRISPAVFNHASFAIWAVVFYCYMTLFLKSFKLFSKLNASQQLINWLYKYKIALHTYNWPYKQKPMGAQVSFTSSKLGGHGHATSKVCGIYHCLTCLNQWYKTKSAAFSCHEVRISWNRTLEYFVL